MAEGRRAQDRELLVDDRRAALRHFVYELRGGFLLVPAALTLAVVVAGGGLSQAELHVPAVAAWSDRWPWTIPRDAGVARDVLTTIAGSIMTVLSVVYSVLLLVLTFASIQFSPRVIVAFMKDRTSQITLGAFLGTFAHCLVTLPLVHPSGFVPTIAVTFAMVLAMASLLCLVVFVHNVALSIQPNRIVARIARETEAVIDAQFTTLLAPPASALRTFLTLPTPTLPGAPVVSEGPGYVQYVDVRRIVAVAKARDVRVYVRRTIGQFAPRGSVVAEIQPAERADEACLRAVRRAFYLGPVRTLENDAEFGVLQIVDVALKAISPAVNDPSTAIACVDYLSEVLIAAATRCTPSAVFADDAGEPRVAVRLTSFARLLDLAFDQLADYAKADVAVSMRILRGLRDVADATRDVAHRAAILRRARLVHDLCARHAPSDDLAELHERLARIEHVDDRSAAQ